MKIQISVRFRAVWSRSSLSTLRAFASLIIQNVSSEKILFRLCESEGWSESSLGDGTFYLLLKYVQTHISNDAFSYAPFVLYKIYWIGCGWDWALRSTWNWPFHAIRNQYMRYNTCISLLPCSTSLCLAFTSPLMICPDMVFDLSWLGVLLLCRCRSQASKIHLWTSD